MTRCPALTGQVIARPGSDLADALRGWLHGEAAPPTTKKRQPVTSTLSFAEGDEVMVAGKNDEKAGYVTGFDGDLVIVQVNGRTLKVKPERLTAIDAPLFDEEE